MELSNILKTIDGTAFAYSQLDCIGKNIDSITVLENYVHLQKINLSNNVIMRLDPLKFIPYLLLVNLSSNKVRSIEPLEGFLQYLISFNLSKNMLTKLTPLTMPDLKKVNLSGNQIAVCEEFGGHPTIEVLDMSDNLLEDLSGMQNMPSLVTLSVARNQIKSLKSRPNEEFTPEPFLKGLSAGAAAGEAPAGLEDPKLLQYMWDRVDGNSPSPWTVTISKVEGNMAILAGEAAIQIQVHQDELDLVQSLFAELGEGDGVVGTLDCRLPQVESKPLEALPSLTSLDMSENNLRGLIGLGKAAPQVTSLKLSANDLGNVKPLAELGMLSMLTSLDISAELGGEVPKKNSVVDVDSFRFELLILNEGLTMIDETEVVEDERAGAKELQYKREHPDED